mmetsp:Transcript_13561/g.35282  ORF Transcript_13561/g.35282 Transcript_13561/m.35282 type:complete len:316 (-) Transcript_13561:64-1011(-)
MRWLCLPLSGSACQSEVVSSASAGMSSLVDSPPPPPPPAGGSNSYPAGGAAPPSEPKHEPAALTAMVSGCLARSAAASEEMPPGSDPAAPNGGCGCSKGVQNCVGGANMVGVMAVPPLNAPLAGPPLTGASCAAVCAGVPGCEADIAGCCTSCCGGGGTAPHMSAGAVRLGGAENGGRAGRKCGATGRLAAMAGGPTTDGSPVSPYSPAQRATGKGGTGTRCSGIAGCTYEGALAPPMPYGPQKPSQNAEHFSWFRSLCRSIVAFRRCTGCAGASSGIGGSVGGSLGKLTRRPSARAWESYARAASTMDSKTPRW